MKRVEIKYNPYKRVSSIKLNNKEITKEKFKVLKNERIQFYLEENRNWRGLFNELVNHVNDKFEVVFTGRKIDYDDVELAYENYCGRNKSKRNKIKLKFKETKNDRDIISEIDNIMRYLEDSEIKDLNTKDIRKIYEEMKNGSLKINVIATMSAGKSTLINAIIGQDIVPSSNQACTANITRIKNISDNKVYIKSKSNNKVYEEKSFNTKEDEKIKKIILDYNSNSKINEVEVQCSMEGIKENNLGLELVDTPGPNNSQDDSHGKITDSVIYDNDKSIVLYILNATQLGTEDDAKLLKKVSEEMKKDGKQSRDRFMFVVNKCDQLDPEKGETIDSILDDVRKYLDGFGIKDPNLFPVTAQLARLIRLSKKEIPLSRAERNFLNGYEDFVEYADLHYEKYATLTPGCKEKVELRLENAIKEEKEIEQALIHTGIVALEESIIEYLEKYTYPIKIEKAINDLALAIKEKNIVSVLDDKIEKLKLNYENLKNESEKELLALEEKENIVEEIETLKEKVENLNVDNKVFTEAYTIIKNDLEEIIEYKELEEKKKEYEKLKKEVQGYLKNGGYAIKQQSMKSKGRSVYVNKKCKLTKEDYADILSRVKSSKEKDYEQAKEVLKRLEGKINKIIEEGYDNLVFEAEINIDDKVEEVLEVYQEYIKMPNFRFDNLVKTKMIKYNFRNKVENNVILEKDEDPMIQKLIELSQSEQSVNFIKVIDESIEEMKKIQNQILSTINDFKSGLEKNIRKTKKEFNSEVDNFRKEIDKSMKKLELKMNEEKIAEDKIKDLSGRRTNLIKIESNLNKIINI